MVSLLSLFEPIQIGPLRLKNRIVRASMCTNFANADGSVNQRILDFYEGMAAGGPGLVMVEMCYVDDIGSKCEYNDIGIYHDSLIAGLSDLAQVIKAQGPAAGLQIFHAGRQRACAEPPILAPSPIPWPDIGIVPKEVSEEEIGKIVEAFGNAAARAKRAGFDLVEIHGAHGYLIAEFLSPDTNRREDRYGGSFPNRMRFAKQVIQRIREAVAESFPISFRMSGDEYVPGGITLEEAKKIAVEIEKEGVGLIHVSAGTRVTNEYLIPPMFLPKGCNLHLAQGVKKIVTIPVIAAGALGDPVLANQAIKEGKADLVSMARPLLADPDLPAKAWRGELRDIRYCIRCNDCVSQIRISRSVKCTVNFRAGKEGHYSYQPVVRPQSVLVVGGGPAGLEAARVAALRGHNVTLCEKESELGGHLRLASFLPELGQLLDYYLYQMDKGKVQVILNKEMDGRAIQALKPDAVILAVGGEPLIPQIPGIGSAHVLTVLDLFNGSEVGQRVVIVGGNIIGCEAAWVLADLGKEIIIVDDGPEIPFDVEKGTKAIFLREFARHGVKFIPRARLARVIDQGLEVYEQKEKRVVPTDNIVLALGFIPREQLLNELDALHINYRAAGDCRLPARLMGAIHDAALAAWQL